MKYYPRFLIVVSLFSIHHFVNAQVDDFSPEMYVLQINNNDQDSLWNTFKSPIVYKNDEGEVEYGIKEYDDLNSLLTQLITDVYSLPNNKSDILLYIHGMRGSTNSAYDQIIWQLKENYLNPLDSKIARIVSIWWPSNSMVYDENKRMAEVVSLQASYLIRDFVRRIQIANKITQGEEIRVNVLCHSLGNLLMENVMDLLDEEDMEVGLFNEAILIAADVENYALEGRRPLVKLSELSERVHVYYNRKDFTLKLSKEFNDSPRLGLNGISRLTRLPDNMFTVDVSEVNDDRGLGAKLMKHFYHRASPFIGQDILKVLNGVTTFEIPNRVDGSRKNMFLLEMEEN